MELPGKLLEGGRAGGLLVSLLKGWRQGAADIGNGGGGWALALCSEMMGRGRALELIGELLEGGWAGELVLWGLEGGSRECEWDQDGDNTVECGCWSCLTSCCRVSV